MRHGFWCLVPILAVLGCAGGGASIPDGGRTRTPVPDGGFTAGNPDGHCSAPIPPEGRLVDVSHPTAVIGTGTAASCTFSALSAAVRRRHHHLRLRRPAPVTIPVTATLNLPIDKDTVIDGGRLVTLDGGGTGADPPLRQPELPGTTRPRLTLQHLRLVNGKTNPTEAIPDAPAPCSQGWNDGAGGAIYMRDGNLSVIDCVFTGNEGARPWARTPAGERHHVLGSKHGVVIAGSTFENNQAATPAGWGACSPSSTSTTASSRQHGDRPRRQQQRPQQVQRA